MGFGNGLTLASPHRILFNVDAKNTKCYSGSGTTVTDSISGTTLSLNNGAAFSNGAFAFDGSNDGLKASAVISGMDFQYTQEFTLEVVAKVKETGTGFLINNRGANDGTQNYRGWALFSSGSSPDTIIKGTVGMYKSSAHHWVGTGCTAADFTNIAYNKWCHMVYSYAGNGIEASLFLNGVDKSDYDNPPNDNTDVIFDGSNVADTINYDSDNLISIGIDSVNDSSYGSQSDIAIARVYDIALTPKEVLKNFNSLRGRFGL